MSAYLEDTDKATLAELLHQVIVGLTTTRYRRRSWLAAASRRERSRWPIEPALPARCSSTACAAPTQMFGRPVTCVTHGDPEG